MMEDPDGFLNDEDMNEDSIEQLMCLKRLSYLMNIPSEIDSNVMYLYKLCKVIVHSSLSIVPIIIISFVV
jgi:hypothetical protein